MKKLVLLAATVALAIPAFGSAAPNPASTAFARAANSPAGRAAFDLDIATTAGSESWSVDGQDVVPFYYEQGMAQFGASSTIFSSRQSLTRTATGCPDAIDVSGPCYDVLEETIDTIPSELRPRGFNHVGGIDVDRSAGPLSATIVAPLETDPPRTVRAYAAYDAVTLRRVGVLVEETPHKYNSWTAVAPGSPFFVTAEDTFKPMRVYEVAGDGNARTITRRADLDVTMASAGIPNMQGCKFTDALTMYCTNWAKRDSYFDVRTEVYRIELSAPIGTPGATATGALAFSLKARPTLGGNAPYGLETEDLAFWGGRMHIQLRGEGLGWVHIVHLAQVA